MRILVVEDEQDLNRILAKTFKAEGYSVDSCFDGVEALDYLEGAEYDAVVLDVMMPRMDGITMMMKVREKGYDFPVIMLSAKSEEVDKIMGLNMGADDYITKPFNLEILLLRIRKLLMWTLKNHDKFKTRDISPSEITISSLDEQLIEKAIRIVEENMDNSEFSVEELSAQIGMSRSGLYKKLMQITGKSPLEFMRILRLKRGRKLLEGSQMNISQISYQVGLSPKQFAKFFKEEFGYLPSEYKKKEEK